MVLIFFRLVPSFNLSLCLAVSLPLFIFPLQSPSSFVFPIPSASSSGRSISPRSTCSCPSSSFSLPRPLLASLPLNLALRLASAGLFSPLPMPRSSFPFAASRYLSAFFPYSPSSGLTISPGLFPFRLHLHPPSFSPSRPHPLPVSQSRPAFSFSSGLYFSAPDVLPVANIVFLPPPP